MADPFSAAGFAPQGTPAPAFDPFAAAGFVPMEQAPQPASMPPVTASDEFGNLVYDNSEAGKKATREASYAPYKFAEGLTFGMMPHVLAGAGALAGKPYAEGLEKARALSAEASKEMPVGSAIMEGAGGAIPTAATFATGAPLITGATRAIPYVGGAMARALMGAGIGGASSTGHDIGSGETETLGPNAARGAGIGAALSLGGDALGRVLQPVVNMGHGLLQGARNVYSGGGKEGVVGQVLREASGDFRNEAAASPIPGITLNAAQATGNPGVASLTNMMAPGMAGTVKTAEDMVQGGKTPAQMDALVKALIPGYAGEEAAPLVNRASARGVKALTDMDAALHGTERSLWNAPELKAPVFNGPGIASGVGGDVNAFPASWRDAVIGPQNKLGAYLRELHELGPNASIADINSVRSRLLGVARDASSGPNPDSVTAASANAMAKSILGHTGADPAIAGTARTVTPGRVESHYLPGEGEVPVYVDPVVTPGRDANSQAWDAYQKARDFTRQFNEAKGYNEFNNILYPNRQGNMQGNPERQFGQFFDVNNGTTAGLSRLSGLADFARMAGHGAQADELANAARDYARASILNTARRGAGVNATGAPMVNPATLAKTIDVAGAPINQSAMLAPIAPELNQVGETAALLNRPSTMRGDMNSTTFEKLRANDLVSAIIGQSGSSALGAAGGGYAGYRAGEPFGVPAWQSVPAGMIAGAALGNRAGPALGRVIAGNPITRGLVSGPSEDIQRRLAVALSSLPEYNRAIAQPMLAGPRAMQPGQASATISAMARALIPQATERTR